MTESLLTLIAGLLAPQSSDRAAAAEKLARLGEAARPAAAALAQAAGDANDEVQNWAVAALEELGPPPPTDIQPLIGLLGSDKPDVAYWSATLLGRLQSAGSPAVAALASVLARHPEMPVRQRAAWALGQIGQADGAREALEQAANDGNARFARLAREALEKLR